MKQNFQSWFFVLLRTASGRAHSVKRASFPCIVLATGLNTIVSSLSRPLPWPSQENSLQALS